MSNRPSLILAFSGMLALGAVSVQAQDKARSFQDQDRNNDGASAGRELGRHGERLGNRNSLGEAVDHSTAIAALVADMAAYPPCGGGGSIATTTVSPLASRPVSVVADGK